MKIPSEEIHQSRKRKYHNVTVHSEDKAGHFKIRHGLGFQALGPEEQSPIEYDCRNSDCGICILRVLEGGDHLSEPTAQEKDFLSAMRADEDERLACQCRIFGDVSVRIEF